MCDHCIEWDGYVWHRYGSQTHYSRKIRLHRAVWEAANGRIADGYQVHHINEDPSDNRLENLELLSHSEHSRIHMPQKISAEGRARGGRAAMAAMARKRLENLKKPLTCARCGVGFFSAAFRPTAYCSRECIEAVRSGAFTGERRMCARCGAAYDATKRVQLYCSKKCNTRAVADRAGERQMRAVMCDQCKREFSSKRSNARFCCHDCALAFHAKRSGRFRKKIADLR